MKIAAAFALMGELFLAGCHQAPQAAMADGPGPVQPDVDKMLTLDRMLVAHQCSNCHAADYLRVGPPMMAIRAIFPDGTAADRERLTQSILRGSVNKWGEAIMPAQTQVTPAQADEIVSIILDKPVAK